MTHPKVHHLHLTARAAIVIAMLALGLAILAVLYRQQTRPALTQQKFDALMASNAQLQARLGAAESRLDSLAAADPTGPTGPGTVLQAASSSRPAFTPSPAPARPVTLPTLGPTPTVATSSAPTTRPVATREPAPTESPVPTLVASLCLLPAPAPAFGCVRL